LLVDGCSYWYWVLVLVLIACYPPVADRLLLAIR